MSDAGDEADDEVDEAPGVDEWRAAEAVADGLDETQSEDER